MRVHAQAAGDLVARYAGAFRHAWRHRAALDGTDRLRHETEFLPAALALQETPVSPAPRIAMWSLMGFAALAVSWATFGHIDVVATAQGKVVPGDRVKTVQPLEAATVRAIHVTDGQQVVAGQPLIELDGTAANADSARALADLNGARLQALRATAFLTALRSGPLALGHLDGVPADRRSEEERLLRSEWAEYTRQLERAEASVAQSTAGLRGTDAVIQKLEASVPIARRLAADYRTLRDKNFAPDHAFLEREQVRIDQEGELATQRAHVGEVRAALQAAVTQRAAVRAEAERTAMERLRDARQREAAGVQDAAKASQRVQLTTLTAPVSGTVQQLAVHTVGGVVTPVQPVLVIVPVDGTVEVEAYLDNQDVGFVHGGQDAEVKIATFPYTRYGTVRSTVTAVSRDAISDEKRGLIYATHVRLQRATVAVDGHQEPITPGMAVTVEIKTGRRRVIDYLLSPLLEHVSESLHER